jgi:hypothetical protein
MKMRYFIIILWLVMSSCSLSSTTCEEHTTWDRPSLNQALVVSGVYLPVGATDVHICTETFHDSRQFIRFTMPASQVDSYALEATGSRLRNNFDGFVGYQASKRWDWWLERYDPALRGTAGLPERFGEVGLAMAVLTQEEIATVWMRLEAD